MSVIVILQNDLPEHLTPRTTSESVLVLTLFVLCILFIAIGRFRQKHVFLYLLQAVFFLKPLEELAREQYKSRSTTSLLFILQFFLITAGAVYWSFFLRTPLFNLNQLLVPLFLPAIYFIYQFIISNIAARITGQASAVLELNYFTLVLTQLVGLLFLLELFVSYFQPAYVTKSTWLLAFTYIAYLIIRFLRGFWIVLNQGVPWYYIILYFWTLEILPLLIVAKLLYYEEFQAWIG